MRKRVLLTILVILLLATTGLIHRPVAAQDKVTIQWLEWWESEYGKATLDELIARFEKAQPNIHVERTGVPWNSMYDTLVTNAQAGTATYDVLGMEGCCFLTGIDKLGGVENLKPYLDADPAFAKGLTDLTVVNWLGRPMMLNWYVFPYSYTYNVDLFKKAGVKPPTNWAEMITATKALKDAGVVKYGFGEGFAGDEHHVIYYIFGSRLAQLGGSFYDKDGKAVFNSPEGVAALQWWKDFYDTGLMMDGAIGLNSGQIRDALAAETIAAMMGGPFEQTNASQTNPKIHLAFPEAWKDKTGGYMWAGSGQAISSNSQHKKEAWEFIKFLLSDETSVWLTGKNFIPYATKAAFATLSKSESPILNKIPAMLNQDPAHNLFLLPTPEQDTLNKAFVVAFQEVMAGKRQPKEALDEVAALWNTELDKLKTK